MATRAKLLGQGVPVSALDRVLPLEPKRDLPTIGARSEFDKRVLTVLLQQFCKHYGYDIAGFLFIVAQRSKSFGSTERPPRSVH
jgi:hypothetical protein